MRVFCLAVNDTEIESVIAAGRKPESRDPRENGDPIPKILDTPVRPENDRGNESISFRNIKIKRRGNMKRVLVLTVMMLMVLGFSMQAQAALELRGEDSLGNRLIYDNDLDITWYDYTNSYNTWQNQMNWAGGLSVTFGSNTYTDWRLPTVTDIGNDGCNYGYSGTDCGYNVDTSTGEMAHLFYDELGNLAQYNTSGSRLLTGFGLTNTGDFENLKSQSTYWLGTEYDRYSAWNFSTTFGGTYNYYKSSLDYAVAVRLGDVSAVAPEPVSMILFGVGGVVMVARRMVIRRRG